MVGNAMKYKWRGVLMSTKYERSDTEGKGGNKYLKYSNIVVRLIGCLLVRLFLSSSISTDGF